MTVTTEIVNVVVTVGLLPVLVIVARRPARRWRSGWAGKVASLASVLVVTFHLGAVLVPAGALVVLGRHRTKADTGGRVALADGWPGA